MGFSWYNARPINRPCVVYVTEIKRTNIYTGCSRVRLWGHCHILRSVALSSLRRGTPILLSQNGAIISIIMLATSYTGPLAKPTCISTSLKWDMRTSFRNCFKLWRSDRKSGSREQKHVYNAVPRSDTYKRRYHISCLFHLIRQLLFWRKAC